MPLESCPKCGYAVSIDGAVCRHCNASFAAVPKLKKLDRGQVFYVSLAVATVIVLFYWRVLPRESAIRPAPAKNGVSSKSPDPAHH